MGLYADRLLPRVIDKVLDNSETRALRRSVTADLAGTVLEVGFGSGLNLEHLPASVDRLLAVEPSSGARTLAAPRIDRAAVTVEYVALQGESLPLDDASVDAVLSTWTLCTIPGLDEAMAELRRVLRPDGRLHFVEHGLHPAPGVQRWQHRLNPVQRALGGGCNLNRPIDSLVESAGFELVELRNPTMRGPRTHAYLYQGVARPAGR